MVTWDKTNSRKVYEERFWSGLPYVKIVADLLRRANFEIKTPDQRPRKIRHKYSDHGDIHILSKGETKFIVEVKSRKIAFSSIGDYPFREVFIDNVNQFNAKKFRIAAIVIISQITEAMFVVPMSSKKYWFTEEITDEEKKVRVKKYLVDKEHCINFENMVQKFKNKINPNLHLMNV